MFVTSEGHPGARLQRALAVGNLTSAEQAAFEIAFVPLTEARLLVELYAEKGGRKYERAALKYLARYPGRGEAVADRRRAGRCAPSRAQSADARALNGTSRARRRHVHDLASCCRGAPLGRRPRPRLHRGQPRHGRGAVANRSLATRSPSRHSVPGRDRRRRVGTGRGAGRGDREGTPGRAAPRTKDRGGRDGTRPGSLPQAPPRPRTSLPVFPAARQEETRLKEAHSAKCGSFMRRFYLRRTIARTMS